MNYYNKYLKYKIKYYNLIKKGLQGGYLDTRPINFYKKEIILASYNLLSYYKNIDDTIDKCNEISSKSKSSLINRNNIHILKDLEKSIKVPYCLYEKINRSAKKGVTLLDIFDETYFLISYNKIETYQEIMYLLLDRDTYRIRQLRLTMI